MQTRSFATELEFQSALVTLKNKVKIIKIWSRLSPWLVVFERGEKKKEEGKNVWLNSNH